MKILFCNIGWMKYYQGNVDGDPIQGGGAYVAEKHHGFEVCNFVPYKGRVYGFVEPPGQKEEKQIRIERLGADLQDEKIDGVTVIWTAKRRDDGTVVIGWYENATVFRHYQKFSKAPPCHDKEKIDGYWIMASAEKAFLLPENERNLRVPRGKGGIGQANIWYPQETDDIVRRVFDLIKEHETKRSIMSRGKNRFLDLERKVMIEQAAIRSCREYYEDRGYDVISVEKDNLGWDLEAMNRDETFQIEVKGLSGDDFVVELTPNEYKKFSERAESYRLVVVTNALENPKIHICRFDHGSGEWIVETERDRKIHIEVRQSAIIKLT